MHGGNWVTWHMDRRRINPPRRIGGRQNRHVVIEVKYNKYYQSTMQTTINHINIFIQHIIYI